MHSVGKHCASRSIHSWRPSIVKTTAASRKSFLFSKAFSGPSRQDLNDHLPLLDQKWQNKWQMSKTKSTSSRTWLNSLTGRGDECKEEGKPQRGKMYILPMFPYPSGDLHMGHLRVYTISDVLARFHRMQGHEVMHPIGWDAFGLPAENAAIERGIDPATWTKSNITKMKSQLQAMNGSWDWDREFATCDPSFYKHTQRLFLMLHEHGLAYQAKSLVNYDPIDKTVLANEQVDANGCSWRSGAKVEKKMLKQWFFRISKFREELLNDLDVLAEDGAWPERVLSMQKNWLGKSIGAQIKFKVTASSKGAFPDVEVFTTRPDTLLGVQYLALAANHPIVQRSAVTDTELQIFLKAIPDLPQDSKAGYKLSRLYAINPLAPEEHSPDAARDPLPIYVAPYVLGDYGDGAVMGVPGHDTRDHAFWRHNCADAIRRVILPAKNASQTSSADTDAPYTPQGVLAPNCGRFSNHTSASATTQIVKYLQSNKLGSPAESWRLRDWLISRQRYWGTPIPIIHCESCGAVPVPDDQLPVELPSVPDHWAAGKVGNPLDDAHDWVNTSCPKCSGPAKRDTDTMDTFVDSSWYFMRFIDPKNDAMPFSPDLADQILPVDIYIGGVEHAILHLLYARFLSKFLATTPLWNSSCHGEPFKKVLAQGMVHGKTLSDPLTGRFLRPDELGYDTSNKPTIVATGQAPNVSFEKMSKSKYNGVDPTACMEKYGADATRAHILFQAPVSEVLEWDEEKIKGITRWLRRIYDHLNGERFQEALWQNAGINMGIPETWTRCETDPTMIGPHHRKLRKTIQMTIVSVTHSYGKTHSLNTVVSDLMGLTNAIVEYSLLEEHHKDSFYWLGLARAWESLIKMMAPITPAFSEECWELLHVHRDPRLPLGSVFDGEFPVQDGTLDSPGFYEEATQMCAVQVNGKLRLAIEIPVPPQGMDGENLKTWIVEEIYKTRDGKAKFVGAMNVKKAKKVIVVKGGKTINFVL